jgi:hypothetical protein
MGVASIENARYFPALAARIGDSLQMRRRMYIDAWAWPGAELTYKSIGGVWHPAINRYFLDHNVTDSPFAVAFGERIQMTARR